MLLELITFASLYLFWCLSLNKYINHDIVGNLHPNRKLKYYQVFWFISISGFFGLSWMAQLMFGGSWGILPPATWIILYILITSKEEKKIQEILEVDDETAKKMLNDPNVSAWSIPKEKVDDWVRFRMDDQSNN